MEILTKLAAEIGKQGRLDVVDTPIIKSSYVLFANNAEAAEKLLLESIVHNKKHYIACLPFNFCNESCHNIDPFIQNLILNSHIETIVGNSCNQYQKYWSTTLGGFVVKEVEDFPYPFTKSKIFDKQNETYSFICYPNIDPEKTTIRDICRQMYILEAMHEFSKLQIDEKLGKKLMQNVVNATADIKLSELLSKLFSGVK